MIEPRIRQPGGFPLATWCSGGLRALALALALLPLAMSPTLAAPLAGREMTLDYSWIGLPLCGAQGISPEFAVDNVPELTRSLQFTLLDPDGLVLARAVVPLPVRGVIPKGTFSFKPPCRTGVYSWTVEARDANDVPLTSAVLARPFY